MTNKATNPNDPMKNGLTKVWSLRFGILLVIPIWSFLFVPAGCNRFTPPPPAPSTITVASLVPAATDVILNMGAGDHLVAISNWDAKLPELDRLPRAGDYRTVDWEKIALARPTVMIVQFAPGKMPTGLEDQARGLHVQPINVRINRLDDIFTTIDQLGEVIGEPAKAKIANEKLHAELDAVRQRVANQPPVRTLLIRSESDLASVGGGNFIDDLLVIAGGKNVLIGGENSYPTIDREQLAALDPQAVILLLPSESPQVIEKAAQFWASMTNLSAVKAGHVHVLSEPYLLLPGMSAGKIAQRLAELLHPEVAKGQP